MIATDNHQHRWQPVGLHGNPKVYAILSCECGKVIRVEPTNAREGEGR